MKKIQLAFAFVLISLVVFSQDSSIDLPDYNTSFKSFGLYTKLHIYKDGTITFENDTVKLEHLAKHIVKSNIRDRGHALKYLPVLIFADKNIKYSRIDSIKTEIATGSLNRLKVVYASKENKTNRVITGIKSNYLKSFFSLTPKQYYLTKRERNLKKKKDSLYQLELKNKGVNMPKPPPLMSDEWYPVVKEAVYGVKKDIIEEVLENKKYDCFTIEESFITDDVSKELLSNKLKSNNYLFIKFDSSTLYKDYFNYLEFIEEFKKNNRSACAEIIELSSEIQEYHRLAKITLCD